MNTGIQILALIFILLIFLSITYFVINNKLNVKYAIIWYFCLVLLALFTIFPDLLGWFTKLFEIQVSSNFIFAFMIGILFIINISLTIIVSEHKERIRTLTQEVSIMKELKNDKK